MIQELSSRIRAKRRVIVGVGNPLRGDDGVGPALVERLQNKTSALLINASDVPENYLGVIQAAQPQVVLIIDAVDLGGEPGDCALIEIDQIGGTKATTHNTSLALVARVIQADTGADVLVVGIQPEQRMFGEGLSGSVQITLDYLARLFGSIG